MLTTHLDGALEIPSSLASRDGLDLSTIRPPVTRSCRGCDDGVAPPYTFGGSTVCADCDGTGRQVVVCCHCDALADLIEADGLGSCASCRDAIEAEAHIPRRPIDEVLREVFEHLARREAARVLAEFIVGPALRRAAETQRTVVTSGEEAA